MTKKITISLEVDFPDGTTKGIAQVELEKKMVKIASIGAYHLQAQKNKNFKVKVE